MSVFILRRRTNGEYTVIKQAEKLRSTEEERNAGFNREHGEYEGVRFVSADHPQFHRSRTGKITIFMQGVAREQDDYSIVLDKMSIRDHFERAVLYFNKNHSNNTDLTLDDVIWEEGQ